ncbi:MAG TPA: hypothetical protein PKY55_13620 [bacterium]|nr:hypothetical protein [bacterium]
MKRTLLLTLFILTLGWTLAAFAGQQDFVLHNQTGLTIDQFYCSPTTTQNWEEDVLGVDVLEDEASAEIRFSRNENSCNWDLMIVDEEGDRIVWSNVNLCEAVRITLYYANGQPTAQIEKAEAEEQDEEEAEEAEDESTEGGAQDFILVNRTGLTIDQFFCSPSKSNNWEEDVLGMDVLEDEASAGITFSREEVSCKWDLMIVDEEGDKIVWSNIDLCKTSRITLFYDNGQPTAAAE